MFRRLLPIACTLCVVLAHHSPSYCRDEPREPPMEPTRIQILIGMLEAPDAHDGVGGGKVKASPAIEELVKIGPKAVPDLVDAVLRSRSTVGGYPALVLDRIGEPAVEPVRKEWERLDDAQRWKLMRFRGQFDYDAVLMFAVASLDSETYEVRQAAIRYAGQYKEPRSRDKLLELLNNDAPPLRWEVVDALASIGGDAVVDALIKLLAPRGWAAKGLGLVPPDSRPPPWWPDGRPYIIEALRKLKAKKAASALLMVLQEKGEGRGYLAAQIVPALVEFEYREALPELQQILTSRPGAYEPSLDTPERFRSRIAEAIERLEKCPM
jgi:HEAT repeat protein